MVERIVVGRPWRGWGRNNIGTIDFCPTDVVQAVVYSQHKSIFWRSLGGVLHPSARDDIGLLVKGLHNIQPVEAILEVWVADYHVIDQIAVAVQFDDNKVFGGSAIVARITRQNNVL